jgi:ribose 5-phosphate isomerase A
VVIADASKLTGQFGRYPLPIEVVAFGHRATAARIDAVLADRGISARARLRLKDGQPVRTDGGNLIYDAPCIAIDDPAALAGALKALTGVVEHGLFLGLAERALIGTDDGILTIYP